MHETAGGTELIVISWDSDDDAWIDDGDQIELSDDALEDPRGLATDGRTGRIFVSGLKEIESAMTRAVVYYADSDGDKRIDEGSSALYFDGTDLTGHGAYPGIHFLPEEQTLLFLTIADDGLGEVDVAFNPGVARPFEQPYQCGTFRDPRSASNQNDNAGVILSGRKLEKVIAVAGNQHQTMCHGVLQNVFIACRRGQHVTHAVDIVPGLREHATYVRRNVMIQQEVHSSAPAI